MEFCIIGAGAIGGVVGAHLIRAGHQVLFCDIDGAHVAAMNNTGLAIEGPVENFLVQAKAVTPADLPATLEHVIIAVKTQDTAAALDLVKDRLVGDGWVLTLQNSHDFDLITEVIGADRTIAAFVNFGADYMAPGLIMQGNIATFMVGEITGTAITSRVEELCEALPYAKPTSNIHGFLATKRVYGAMLTAGAITDLSIADSLSDPRFRELMIAVADEVIADLDFELEPFDGFDPYDVAGSIEALVLLNRNSAKSHSGIYRDLAIRRRKSEVHALFDDLSGPLARAILEIVKEIEAGYRICQVANLQLLQAYHQVSLRDREIHAVVELQSAPRRALEGPLLGEVVGVKDLVDLAGVAKQNGNAALNPVVAVNDNPVIAHLRKMGADIFARTALLEYAAGAVGEDVPETMNPYDPTKTAGGSSGGSAALVGAGISRISVGSDTGGSIRIPASYCGVVGFKPTYNKLSLQGVTALSPTFDHLGFLTSTVGDLSRVWATIEDEPATSVGKRIGLDRSILSDPAIRPDVLENFTIALEKLKSAGFTVEEFDASVHRDLEATFEPILLFELWQVHGDRATKDSAHFGAQTLRLILAAKDVDEAMYKRALARRLELLPVSQELYKRFDALISPTVPYVAPATTPPIDTELGAIEGKFTAIYNATGDPAVSLPSGFNKAGLPIGIQLATAFNTDWQLIQVARAVEAALAISA